MEALIYVQIALLSLLQSTEDATKFYNKKVDELGTNLKDLESIVQGKSNNLRVVEEGQSIRLPRPRNSHTNYMLVLRQKVLSGGSNGTPATA